MTTLKDLSRHLGLSVTQVSRALNGHEDVSKTTRERVQEASKRLNYQANASARRLVTGRSGIVGLVYSEVPSPSEAWAFSQFVSGLSTTFTKLGRQFMLHIADDESGGLGVYERLVRSRSIDGFVLDRPLVEDDRVNFLRRNKVPFVLHGQTMDRPDYPFFDIDNVAVSYDLTRYLLDRGHRRIAFINGPRPASYVERRFVGYKKAMQEKGCRLQPDFAVFGQMTEETGLLETVRLFQSGGAKPTAMIAGNMRIAKGIIDALKALGLSVPRDVSLVAHDDSLPDVAYSTLEVPLTVTFSPLSNSWEPLAHFLCGTLDGQPLSDVQRMEPHTFIERDSVRDA